MGTSGSVISLQNYRSARRTIVKSVPFAEAVQMEIVASPLPVPANLKPSTAVIEPVVVELEELPPGVSVLDRPWIILPKSREKISLQDCILVTQRNWIANGCPNYWTNTALHLTTGLSSVGAWILSRSVSSIQSSAPTAWDEATNSVDRKYGNTLSGAQRLIITAKWKASGWPGFEDLRPVQLSSSKMLYRLSRRLAIAKLRQFSDHIC